MVKVKSKTVKHSDSDLIKSGLQVVTYTKLNKPSIPANCITRTSLFEQLEKNWHLPLTLVSAATGCGKSTTVSQWLDKSNHKYGWLSLDKEHNDIDVLLTYLLAIFKKVWPEKTFGLEYLLNGNNLPQNAIVSTIINDIFRQENQFVLVLDDYHLISEEKIHMIFNGILLHPPDNLHLVILTQMDPPLKLARLRAKLQLNEVRMRDLAFSTDEAFKLRSLIFKEASNDQVKTLVEKSDGWVTGVTVGLLGMAQGIKFEKVLQALNSRTSIISELFDEAVLDGLPIESQKWLELTTLVDRFSQDLISRMIASIDDNYLNEIPVEEYIRNSSKRNLFLIPLDDTGEWFRYHHLFQNQIKKQAEKHFSNMEISSLYKAASGWFEEKELLEEALTYALRSKDIDFAVGLFSRFRHKLLNSEQLQRLYRLTNQFPEDVWSNNPELLINLAMLQHYNSNFDGMHQYLSRAEKLLNGLNIPNEHEKHLLGEYHGVSTYLSYMLGDFEQAIYHGEKCMELLPADTPNFFREQSVGWYAFAKQARGDSLVGMDRLESEYKTLANTNHYFKMRLLQGKLIFYMFEGNTSHLYQDGSSLANICSPNTYPGSWVIGMYSIVYHLYLDNQLEKVSGFHNELRLHRYVSRPFWIMHHFFIECLSAMAKASWQKVEYCITECEELAIELAIEPLIGMVKAFQVEYYLRRNDVDRAREISTLANFEPQPPTFFYYIPQLTQVKLLYRTNKKEKANVLLENLLNTGKQRNNKNLLIQALALQAVIHESEGNVEAAKKILNEVLLLTTETKNIRTFLDLGDPMHRLLRDIAENQPEDKQVRDLLQAFEDNNKTVLKSEPTLTGTREKHFDSLSNRELEILILVNQGLKNDAIADQLFISTDTVKKHLYRAYQKLGVKNRTGAVKKLKALGLITSH